MQRNSKFLSTKFHSWRERHSVEPQLEGSGINFKAINSRSRFEWFLKFQRRGADLLYIAPKKFALKFDRFGSSRVKFYFLNLTPWRK